MERNAWSSKPYKNVPEHFIPLLKASYLFYALGIRDELLDCVEVRITAASMRKDPTLANYSSIMTKFLEKAKQNPTKLYLQVQSFACHGYHVGGF
jgi:hypothetical protein